MPRGIEMIRSDLLMVLREEERSQEYTRDEFNGLWSMKDRRRRLTELSRELVDAIGEPPQGGRLVVLPLAADDPAVTVLSPQEMACALCD